MLSVLNRFAHGFVLVPLLKLFQQRNVFHYLVEHEEQTIVEISRALKANEGHFRVALRMLQALGWLQIENQHYVRLSCPDWQKKIAIPDAVNSLYRGDNFDALLSIESLPDLSRLMAYSKDNQTQYSQQLCDILDGPLSVILLLIFGRKKSPELLNLNSPVIREFFVHKGWLEHDELTELGRFLLDRSLNLGVTASYWPMLQRIEQLIFGDPSLVFTRDKRGHENHIDRTLNVEGSGFQHEKFFLNVDVIIKTIFSRSPIANQPKYIVDMGCGDGSLLHRIYDVVKNKTLRGQQLNQYPLLMVGVDFNEKSLDAARKTLEHIPHILLLGDVSNPQQLLVDLTQHGIDSLEQCLHIRSFLDHEIPYQEPSITASGQGQTTGVYVAADGKSISPANMYQRYVEHFSRWAEATTQHGLIVLEVHSPSAVNLAEYVDECESIHFDALQAFSGQHLLTADAFFSAAAEAGLFVQKESFKRFPQTFPFTRITLNWFQRQNYSIRKANLNDLPSLMELEHACWDKALQVSESVIAQRVEQQGSYVVVVEGNVVGVVYSQRIADGSQLLTSTFQTISTMHHPMHPILQLIAVNVLPSMQHLGLGDALLSFMLQLALLKEDINEVVGVTRCKHYLAYADEHSYDDYVFRQDDNQLATDPILLFHTSHGAIIKGIVPNYRPEDRDNCGNGILITYHLHDEWINPTSTSQNEVKHLTPELIEEVVKKSVTYQLQSHQHASYVETSAFKDLGLDSLDLTELRNVLNQKLALSLETSIFFSYSTPLSLIQHLSQTLLPSIAASTPIESNNLKEISSADDSIAIIGIGCRFPGGIEDAESFWQLLLEEKNVIQKVPANRWSSTLTAAEVGASYGGFIENIKQFDADFFGITPREAHYIDPQQRLVLETTWKALEHAHLDPDSLRGSNTGVFVGQFSHDYEWLQLKANEANDYQTYFSTGNTASITAGRIAYTFDFQGPVLTVDTACSSSLMAVHLACQSIKQGECDLALAGGVNLMLSPELSLTFARSGMLAGDGQCKVFDSRADGYVRGEGCGMVVLKSLKQALLDNDTILAVIKSTAVNQDGASNGLTAPNGKAQVKLIQKALAVAQIEPEDVAYFEAHGTGTKLGDPVEMQAIATIFSSSSKLRKSPLLIGSVKTNLGHTEAASGIAGLIKVILSLQHAYVPKHLNLNEINPLVEAELTKISAVISREGQVLEPSSNKPLYALINSFGFSGTNVHAVIESAPQCENQTKKPVLPGYAFQKTEYWFPERAFDTRLRDDLDAIADSSKTETLVASVKDVPDQVIAMIRDVLQFPPEKKLNVDQTFKDLGVDSIMALDISYQLTTLLSQPVHAGIIYDYPTTTALIQYALSFSQEAPIESSPQHVATLDTNEPIAIIGYGCRLPGSCNNPEEFWQLLHTGKNGVIDIGNKRWDMDEFYHSSPDAVGKMYCRHAGLMDDIDKFDAEFFGISPHEAECMDPQQRILLEVAWQTLENAGYVSNVSAGDNAGVFIGLMSADYGQRQLTMNHAADITAHMSSGSALSVAAGRLSYFLGWQGPALTIDTACSSSLVAIHTACQSLRNNECSIALAGGINLLLTPELSIALSRARMLAADGFCKPFSETANGYVRSEGCGLVLLKPLSKAIADRDTIAGVIQGSAINQDGRSQGLTAPNGQAQKAVIQKALHASQVQADDVSYVEAHGTGTSLGDPIEVNALVETYRANSTKPLVIGSVKSNIGHCETAAGVAGLIKIILMFKHQQIAANLHLEQVSSRLLSDDRKSILFAGHAQKWMADEQPRVAALSSFGFSGTNAHLIIMEAPRHLTVRSEHQGNQLLTLSARQPQALSELVANMIHFLQTDKTSDFSDICYTTLCGRVHFSYRIAFICKDKIDALNQLIRFQPQSFDGQAVTPNKTIVELMADGANLQHALHCYLHGGIIDATAFYEAIDSLKIDLPTYPFQGQSYWSIPRTIRLPDPLLGQKLHVAGMSTTVYEQRLSPTTPFHLADHQLQNTIVIPGAAHIALAVMALLDVIGKNTDDIELTNISFSKPCIVQASTDYLLQHVVRLKQENEYWIEGHSAVNMASNWDLHYQVTAQRISKNTVRYVESIADIQSRLMNNHDGAMYYQKLANVGYHLSNDFRLIQQIWFSDKESLARMDWPKSLVSTSFLIPPGLLDACFQTTLIAAPFQGVLSEDGSELYVPFAIDKLLIHSMESKLYWCHCKRRLDERSDFAMHDITLLDESGKIGLQIIGLTTSRLSKHRLLKQPLDNNFYHLSWQPLSVAGTVNPLDGTWLLCADKQTIAGQLAEKMTSLGALCLLIDNQSEFFERIAQHKVRGVIYLWPVGSPTTAEIQDPSLPEYEHLLHLTQALTLLTDPPQLFLVTQSAQQVIDRDVEMSPLQSGVWGFGRVFAQEHPEFKTVIVDLDKQDPMPLAHQLLSIITQENDEENQWAIRGNKTFVPRLQTLPINEDIQLSDHVHSQATYVITGGFGGLARVFIDGLITNNASSIALLVRRSATLEEQAYLDRWTAKGIHIRVYNGDMTDAIFMRETFTSIANELPPIKGVIHTAGVVRDGMIAQQPLANFMHVMQAKVMGTSLLYQLTRLMDLDFFVVCSSAASLLGSKGQANYAVANSYLDALAHLAQQEGCVMTSINWGSWAEVGMANQLITRDERHQAAITPAQGLMAFAKAIASRKSQLAYIPGGLPALQAIYSHHHHHRLLANLMPDEKSSKPILADKNLVLTLHQFELPLRQKLLQDHIMAIIVATMKLPSGTELGENENLQNLGFDSLLAVDLRNNLAQLIDKNLPVTLLYDYPTLKLITLALLRVLELHEPSSFKANESTREEATEQMDNAAIEAALQAHIDELLPIGDGHDR